MLLLNELGAADIDDRLLPEPGVNTMLLLNFSHPLSADQLARVAELAGREIECVVDVPAQLDHQFPFPEQVRRLADAVELTPAQWQAGDMLVNPPSLAPIACLLVAELHGRMGHFPSLLRMRPVAGAAPPRYEPAEILHLQAVRDSARARR